MKTTNSTIIRKSLLGLLSAAAIMAGSAMPAFAETQITSFTKEYQANIPNNAETSAYPSPAETFSFQDSKGNPNQADLVAVKYTSFNTEISRLQYITDLTTNVPTSTNTVMNLALGTAAFDVGDAGTKDKMSKTVSISIPDGSAFTKPGNYYYYFTESARNTAGVVYSPTKYLILVPVVSGTNGVTVDTTNIRILKDLTEGDKVNSVVNSYNAGTFDFKKVVEGTLGDTTQTFQVSVTLTRPRGKTVSSTIYVTNAGSANVPVEAELVNIAPADWTSDTIIKTFTVKNGTDIRFSNLPAGTEYLVKENDAPGYVTTYSKGDITSPIASDNLTQTMNPGESASIVITNHRDQIVDTGVFTSNNTVCDLCLFRFRKR